MKRICIGGVLLLALAVSAPAFAQFKCTQPGGRTTYQQTPCDANDAEKKVDHVKMAAPSAAAGGTNWGAIARGEPAVGMTVKELTQAIGSPATVNAAQYGGRALDEYVYQRGNRTLYVYLENGVVKAVQNGAASAAPAEVRATQSRCPSPEQIRDMEFEASKIANRNNRGMHDSLARARACQ